ncbi:MAG: hypothetical protein V1694_10130 [Candidatus Eisenbacteria bacterium]
MRFWPSFRRGSIETPGTVPDSGRDRGTEFTGEDEALVLKVAQRIVRMRMSVPAIFLLESSKPLAFLGGQLLIFLEPFVQTLFNFAQYQRFALLMEDRGNWERLVRKVEDLEAEFAEREKQEKKVEKAEKKRKRKQ